MLQNNPLVDVWKRIEAGEKLIIEKNSIGDLIITFVTPGSVTKECWKARHIPFEQVEKEDVWEEVEELINQVDNMMSHKHIYNPENG